MSDDYTDSSGGRSIGRDDMSAHDTVELRISIHARPHESADDFWRQLEDRLRKKAKLSACRSDRASADVSVHLFNVDDFADGAAKDAAIHRIAVNVAAVNILLEPAISDAQGHQRMEEALSGLAGPADYVRFASKKDAQTASPARYARLVAGYLVERFAAPPAPEKRGEPMNNANETLQRNDAQLDLIRSSERPSGAANDRSERRAQRRAERSAKRELRKTAKSESGMVADSAGAALVPEVDRSRKEARKRAKMDAQHAAGDRPEQRARKETTGDESRARKGRKTVSPPGEKGRDRASGADELRRRKDGSRERRSDAVAAADNVKSAGRPDEKGQHLQRSGSIGGGENTQRVPRPVPIRIRISGLSTKSLAGLHSAIERKSPGIVFVAAETKQKPHAAIYAFEDHAVDADTIARCLEPIAKEGVRVRIFLDRASSAENLRDVNSAIVKLASACGGRVLRVAAKLDRYDGLQKADDDGLTGAACELIADSILGLVASVLSRPSLAPLELLTPPDLAEARILADSGPEFLAQLRWNRPIPPRLLRTHSSKETMEALVGEKVVLPSQAIFALSAPIAWPQEMPDRAAAIQILGLEFLIGPLDYWFSKAGGRSSSQIGEIDAMLKQHGLKASEILSRAEKIMLDFAQNYPPDRASAAWKETAISRRVRVYALYVLCCKIAIARRIRFDAKAFTIIFRHLADLIERLRADDFYKPASPEGFQQDALLIGLALVLRGSDYGDRLLAESLDRLQRLQLDAGLTSDGVWRAGTFSDHCSLLALLRTILVEFDKSDAVMIEPFAAAAKKMTLFAEAMLKSNGQPPAFDDSRQKSYARQLSGTRRALAQAGGKNIPMSKIEAKPRIVETYVFRDAQYFISHSTQNVSTESSLVLLHADGPSILEGDPGGVTLAFAHGETDLLIRAEPEEANRRDKSSLFDPALRNGYHVNGSGFDMRGDLGSDAARIVKSWRGSGWAAAKSVDETSSTAAVSRIIVHLKEVHALLVVDSLRSYDGMDATFEQFWHVAPGLIAPPSSPMPLRFAVAGGGGLVVSLDNHDAITIESEGDGTRIRREVRMAEGILASLFQWTEEEGATGMVDIARNESVGWTATMSGAGFSGQFILSGEDLVFERFATG